MVVKNENIPNTNDNLSEEKSKKIISHYETVIVKLMEELNQQRQLLQKYRCKTRSQENTIVSLRKRVKATKQEQTGNDKFKAKIEDKGVQCNTMRSLIKDLKDEIEALQLEIDSTDENNNCNIEVSDKVFNTKTSGQGTTYNHKITASTPIFIFYKTIFPRLRMVVVHNPIQNKWLSNLIYLSEQIYVGVIWKSDMSMPYVVISTNRKVISKIFTGLKI